MKTCSGSRGISWSDDCFANLFQRSTAFWSIRSSGVVVMGTYIRTISKWGSRKVLCACGLMVFFLELEIIF
jgi:hypothetical protein